MSKLDAKFKVHDCTENLVFKSLSHKETTKRSNSKQVKSLKTFKWVTITLAAHHTKIIKKSVALTN